MSDKSSVMCPHCNKWSLTWDSDEDAEECGYTEEGIVSFYHCMDCGAFIEIMVPTKDKEPVPVEIEGGERTWWYVCGECHTAVNPKDKICPGCKRELKWDE